MIRLKDRPLLQVRVSFELTRLSPQHLIEAYDRLMPIARRVHTRANLGDFPVSSLKTTKAGGKR
jgi:hypothetical protein